MIRKQLILSLLTLCCSLSLSAQQDNWQLVWSDEFNTDGAPDETVWNFENGYSRNEEAQWYQPDNAYCKDGYLVIEARKEHNRANPLFEAGSHECRKKPKHIGYTSSSLTTAGKKEFLYGRFEVKARIPVAKGAWPAIWTLGSGMEWPSCGEIDIMEYYQIDGEPHILANAAWGTDRKWNAKWNSKTIPFSYFTDKQDDWASQFHTWRMDWDETAIKLYLDDELMNEIPLSTTINGSIGQGSNPFTKPQYLLLNLALGGINGGPIDEAALPMKYEIDYVRVYQKQPAMIASGELWRDNNGDLINAHGGGLLYHNNRYYWYGEHRPVKGFTTEVGVTCYSSADLCNWQYEGVALPVVTDESLMSNIEKGCIMERPKVIYNQATRQFVMWFHLELKGQGYAAAHAAVAVSDTPQGPFQFLKSGRVNAGIYPENMTKQQRRKKLSAKKYKEWWTPQWYAALEEGLLLKRHLNEGQMSRDMTLFVDDDEKAYHIYSSEENLTLHIAELCDDYLSHTGKYIRIFPGGHNEAPAIFKHNDTYWLITSGCTGWKPNEARMFSATSLWGPWQQHDNPCVGDGGHITFGGQSTFIAPIQGSDNRFMFMADEWRPESLADSRYIWLPINFTSENKPYISWVDRWSPLDSPSRELTDHITTDNLLPQLID